MYEQGCDTVILGCTELPLVFGESAPVGYVCSISLLAESLLQAACPPQLTKVIKDEKSSSVIRWLGA
ncbi:MAG: hypothetical protein JWQ10_608 [Herbaspirillum sp.]|nr:hypothetical protein [Herbaspirillum sp.]